VKKKILVPLAKAASSPEIIVGLTWLR
jgi:hypothetical protein